MINSHFHHGHIGHLLKSRATVSHIINSRLVDGEGYKWPHNVLYLANNTLVNPLPHGIFLRVAQAQMLCMIWTMCGRVRSHGLQKLPD